MQRIHEQITLLKHLFLILKNLKDDIAHLRVQLSEANHKLCQLQTFRTSVARLLHLRDIPHSSLLQRLQTLCQAHQVSSTNSIAIWLFYLTSLCKS